MRTNLRKTKPMKRDLVYTTGELPTRPFAATRFLTPSPHQNRPRRARVEKVGLVPRISAAVHAGVALSRARLILFRGRARPPLSGEATDPRRSARRMAERAS